MSVVVRHWPQIEKHLLARLDQLHQQMEKASDEREWSVLQGQCKALREMLALPATLTVLAE